MTPSPWDQEIRSAIETRRLLGVRYGGAERVVEPHDYGLRHGTANVLVFQIERAAPPPGTRVTGWRLLDVSSIEACVVLDRPFAGSRGASHTQHYEWDVLFARVK